MKTSVVKVTKTTEQEGEGNVPCFVKGLESNMIALSGKPYCLEVELADCSNTTISWCLNGHKLNKDEPAYEFLVNDRGGYLLLIKDVGPTDEGEYMCCATNPHGQVDNKAFLTVLPGLSNLTNHFLFINSLNIIKFNYFQIKLNKFKFYFNNFQKINFYFNLSALGTYSSKLKKILNYLLGFSLVILFISISWF